MNNKNEIETTKELVSEFRKSFRTMYPEKK